MKIRLAKYPPTMKCAGQHFQEPDPGRTAEKVRRQIPERVIREGKAPSAYFLEQVGAKGMRSGGIHVADYHANLIYNSGDGTARELCELIGELKIAGAVTVRPGTGGRGAVRRIFARRTAAN